MDIKVTLIIDGENFDDIPYEQQLKVKNKITDKVEVWAVDIIQKRIREGKNDIDTLLDIES